METNSNMPRQRNRRADRLTANEASPVQQVVPAQSVIQVQQPMVQAQQPMVQAQPVTPAPPMYAQQPVQPMQTYQQQPMPVQPQRMQSQPRVAMPPQQGYPQHSAYPAYQQVPPMASAQPMAPAQPVQRMQAYPPQQTAQPVRTAPVHQVQYAPRARAAAPQWAPQPAAEVPHARARHGLSREKAKEARAAQKEAAIKARQEAIEKAKWQAEKAEWEAEKARRAKEKSAEETGAQPKKKVSGWLTTAISLSLICVMALVAAYYLMQAYLVQQEEARIAAHKAILNNYHVTEQADGTMRVTWQDTIERYAAQYNLQPAFVTAIIRNESSFRTNAESNVGARGLMQMMPDTAEWIAGKLDDYSYNFDNMWDAETNIRYGCWYLGYLSRLFHGDAMLVSAAYHAGQTTVTQWLSDPNKSSDGVTLDLSKLADGPTKQYIGRVTQTYGIYQSLLYPDEAFAAKSAPVPSGSGFGITIER